MRTPLESMGMNLVYYTNISVERSRNHEDDMAAVEDKEEKEDRFSRPQGDEGRAQGPGRAPR